MPVPYLTFNKHASIVVKKASPARPILKGVFHREDGALIATDSHRLYLANNSQERKDNAVISPITGEKIDGSFPDVNRIIPENFIATYFIQDTKATIEALKVLQSAALYGVARDKQKKDYVSIALNAKISRVSYESVNGFCDAKYEEDESSINTQSDLTIYTNAQYMIEALSFLLDCGATSNVKVGLTGELSPLLLTYNDVQALVLPIRRA